MNNPHPKANIFGWLSLLCWSPYFAAGARLFQHGPDWLFIILIYGMLYGCFPATLFAIIAAATTKNKWWIAQAALSLVASVYIVWDQYQHPFYI